MPLQDFKVCAIDGYFNICDTFDMTDTKVVTVNEFAAALNVSHDTVARWVKLGKVKGKKKGPFPAKNSPILIPASELERVKKLMDEPQGSSHS